MDCCNYVQYRHHQPYYGSQYYDPLPPPAAAYPGAAAEFYHGSQQVYHEYYAAASTGPYYSQQWPCATASFQDYVYNPKEARIRKAMRDATRERSIGASPMLPRPSARRAPHSWVSPHEELMMSPLGSGMRSGAAMDSPVCGFPLPSPGSGQFMAAAMSGGGGYNKLEPPPMPPTTSNYMQSNPLAQLQQHTEMWHDYQTMRPRSSGNPFMLPEVSQYHQQPNMAGNGMMHMEKQQHQQHQQQQQQQMQLPMGPETPPHTNENIPPPEDMSVAASVAAANAEKMHRGAEAAEFEEKSVLESDPQPMEPSQEHFMQVFEQAEPLEERHQNQQPFERADDAKIKKDSSGNFLHLPLSSQCLPTSPGAFVNDVRFHHDYIWEYFENKPSMTLMNITTHNGTTFPYATYNPLNMADAQSNEAQVFENIVEPGFYHTDVGYIPMANVANK